MRSASTRSVFHFVRAKARRVDQSLEKVTLRFCPEAAGEHSKRDRQYAHFNHLPDTICVAPQIEVLELPWKLGLMAHEFGHALAFKRKGEKHSEEDANRMGGQIIGTPVIFKGPQRLEWADPVKGGLS